MLRTGPTELGAIASHQAFTKLRNLSKLARASSLHGNHVRSHVSSSPDTARAQSRLYSLASPARRSQSRSEPDIVPGDIKATLEAHRRRYQETRISWKYTTGDDATSGTSGDWQTVKKVAGGNIRERREARFLPDRPPRDLAKLDPVEEGPPPGKPSPARPPPEKRVIAYRRSGSKQERRRGRAGFDTGPGRIISPDTGNKAQDLPFWPFAVPEQRTVPDMDREQQ